MSVALEECCVGGHRVALEAAGKGAARGFSQVLVGKPREAVSLLDVVFLAVGVLANQLEVYQAVLRRVFAVQSVIFLFLDFTFWQGRLFLCTFSHSCAQLLVFLGAHVLEG